MNATSTESVLLDDIQNATSAAATATNNSTYFDELYDDATAVMLMTTREMLTSDGDDDGGQTLAERLFLLSDAQRAETEAALMYARYVIMAVALPLTICNVVVFLQPAMRGATSVYMIGLSLAQLLYILTNVVQRVMESAYEKPMESYAYLLYSVYISSYLSIVVRRASYLVMCYVSGERLYAVLRPFHIKDFVLTRYPVTFTALTYLLSAAWHTFMLVKSGIVQKTSSRTGKLYYAFVYTTIYNDNPSIADGFGAAAPILMTYIPLILLIALNAVTVWAYKRHNVSTRGVSSTSSEDEKQRHERQLTVTILATTVSYVVLSLPYAFHNLIKNSVEEYDKRVKYQNMYYVMRSLGFNLTVLSCAIDFLCFFFLSSTYRNTFLALIRVKGAKTKGDKKAGTDVSGGSSGSRTFGTDAESGSKQ